MGHHGSDEPSPEMAEMLKKLHDAEKRGKDESFVQRMVKAESPTFGATGEYPMGSIDKSDEGELIFGITSHRGKVILNFGKPVAWLGMDARQAAALAATLIQHANRCRDINGEHKTQANAKEHASAPSTEPA